MSSLSLVLLVLLAGFAFSVSCFAVRRELLASLSSPFWRSAWWDSRCMSLLRDFWRLSWRAVLSLLIAAFCLSSLIGETLYASGWAAAQGGRIPEARGILKTARAIAPLRDEMRKGPAYLALRYADQLLLQDVIGDFRQALSTDPYAPDLLNALIWVEMLANDQGAAEAALIRLQRVEPGYVPAYLTAR